MRQIVSAFDNEWSPELLEEVYQGIEEIAVGEWGYDIFPNQIEIISSEGMLEAYATIGLPVMYHHWSFGKRYLSQSRLYKAGLMGLAYEIVINSDPCIAYLMEANTLTMQTIVMAHACFGHNCFANDTQLLTTSGWKNREEVFEGDLIATLNRETRRIEYRPVRRKFEYDYNGPMCHFKNSSADHLVTPNHQMVYWSKALEKVKECDAADWTATGTYALVSGVVADGDVGAEDNSDYTDEELRMLVWCITDGNLSYAPTGYWRFHLKKQRKIVRLLTLLDELGLDYKTSPTRKGNVKIAVHLDNRFTKHLPSDFSISPRQFNIFAREWLQTDGSLQAKPSSQHEDSGILFTNDKHHVDKIQELAVRSGAKTSYRQDDSGVYTINIRLNVQIVQLSRPPLTGMIDYSGKVWCVEVENHTVIARRNGRVLITGNSFFKNNYLFKQWTHPDWIIDYLGYAKRYITRQEEIHGYDAVEAVLDAAHTLSHYSVDKYNKRERSKAQLEADLKARLAWEDSQYDELVSPFRDRKVVKDTDEVAIEETENLLYFIEKQAPNLHDWQREVIRIVRKIGQYFYPQRQTSVMNEGFATTSHYEICHELWDRGLVDERFMLEFIRAHSGVLGQQPIGIGDLRQINIYKLGFTMFQDIKRRCQKPTKEDELLFPEQVGRPFRDVYFEAVKSYKDESFVLQYLSPQVIRDMRLMSLLDDDRNASFYQVSGSADDEFFHHVRQQLSYNYDLGLAQPHISIFDVDWKGSRTLKLRHDVHRRRPLDEKETQKILKQVHRLWQFPVSIESCYDEGKKTHLTYPS